ncbi:MAG: hypothetical protein UT29_C0001G0094 [Candidatus Yanofskybacteria bacterium GW2011_GWA1_39_13]|uniref:Uncharacterized protein n=1 Tax=Yanofskybacteria sp. (strain GW2011_GWA1_39_13) TaxID=1619019 RepID=A0A0G0MF06_YANXG|nr:MAG: hypothetical protein UT29_C0001G0094 [Candidatus Yanofskybacteria bacterium GW2011_GWA1_39_13]
MSGRRDLPTTLADFRRLGRRPSSRFLSPTVREISLRFSLLDANKVVCLLHPSFRVAPVGPPGFEPGVSRTRIVRVTVTLRPEIKRNTSSFFPSPPPQSPSLSFLMIFLILLGTLYLIHGFFVLDILLYFLTDHLLLQLKDSLKSIQP